MTARLHQSAAEELGMRARMMGLLQAATKEAGMSAPGDLSAAPLDALIVTGAFALYEHRRIDSYGMPVDQALRLPTLEGVGAGIAMAGAVAIGMFALGGMQVKGFAPNQGAIGFLYKPFDAAVLLSTIQPALNSSAKD